MAKEKAKPDYDEAPNNETPTDVQAPAPVVDTPEVPKPKFTIDTNHGDNGLTEITMNYA